MLNVYQSPKEKRKKKFRLKEEKAELKYTFQDLITHVKATNFYLMVIAMILLGIFIKLILLY